MKKLLYSMIIVLLIIPFFVLTSTKAATNEYTVQSIKNDGTITNLGTFNDYNSAKNKMNSYKSTVNDVAVVKRNGVIINAAYGIFRPNSNLSTVNLYSDYGTGYISPPYNSDTLFLDYNPNNNRVQIMISGLKAWISIDNGTIYPISYITSGSNLYDVNKKYVKILYAKGIRLREGPGTEYRQMGCNGSNTCDTAQGGIWTKAGAIYEWLNYGQLTNDGKNDWYKVNINGNIGYIANEVAARDLEEYIPTLGNKQDFKTYYYVDNGELYHQYYVEAVSNKYWTTRLGKAPLYLKANVRYYSFDGNYFYDDLTKMVNDLRNGNYNNAVNKLPYYNYYQYLPTRTETHYNADNLNSYIGYNSKIDRSKYYQLVWNESLQKYKWTSYGNWDSFPAGQSMLYGEGASFIESQTTYGVNAATTLALAITESGWGRSYMSVREYNIFGHGAFDTAPDEYAASYESIKAGIMAHAFKYIALDYSNPISGYHYYGSHYGNKLSGNNVSYASDAYWGEKMAGNYYSLDKNFGFQDFNQRLTLGVKQISAAAPVYSEPKTSSTMYYKLKNVPNVPVTILEEVTGESINGNNVWYKIQSDVPIDASRKLVDLNLGTYNFETSYAYIHSSYIYKESKAPIITAKDLNIKNGTSFNPLSGVSAYDAFDGDVTSKITVSSNNVNVTKTGVYNVTYKVTDSENNTATKTIKVTVESNNKPVISANDQTIDLGSTFDPLKNVKATDVEDGDITKKIVAASNNVNTTKVGTYEVTYKITDSDNNVVMKTVKITVVSNSKPVISANNQTIDLGSAFDPLKNVKATDTEDGDITKKIVVTTNNVNVSNPGTYNVTYKVTDSNNNTVTKTISVIVLSTKPVINANNQTINIGSSFNPLKNVTAIDKEDGDITKNIVVIGNNVNVNKVGTYQVTYQVIDSSKQTVTKTVSITVISNKPVITAETISIYTREKFDPLTGVKATDIEDGDITKKVVVTSNNVNTSKAGTYTVVYSVTDNHQNTVTKTRTVKVVDRPLETKEAIFYLDYLKNVNGKLQLKGFNTINSINNNLDTNITYDIVFINIETGKEYIQAATRITSKNEMTRPVVGLDDKDYTYSWFKLDISLKDLPSGNYQMKVISKSDKYQSISVISNKLYNKQDTSYSGDKSVIIRNNFNDKTAPIELIIRDKQLASKTASPVYNQYDTYRTFEFTKNGLLHLKGVSYSYGMNLGKNVNVTRDIIFESVDNYNSIYRYSLGSITNGLYDVVLPVDDNLGKERAWYDKEIDLKNIPIGKYVIYITTSSNITDISEFTEKLNRDISNITTIVNNKKYSFKINQSRGNRIELIVEKA